MGYFVLMAAMAVSSLAVLWLAYKSAKSHEEQSHHF
jgi:hypothetical protein